MQEWIPKGGHKYQADGWISYLRELLYIEAVAMLVASASAEEDGCYLSEFFKENPLEHFSISQIALGCQKAPKLGHLCEDSQKIALNFFLNACKLLEEN